MKAECCSDKIERTLPLQYVSLRGERKQNPVPAIPNNPFGLGVGKTTFRQIVHNQDPQLQLQGIMKGPSQQVIEMEGRIPSLLKILAVSLIAVSSSPLEESSHPNWLPCPGVFLE